MTAFGYVVIALAIAAVAYFFLRRRVRTYFALRGDRVVSCPDNNETVAVRIDATRAALDSATGGGRWRLESCTRWPEKAGCGQECLKQIEAAPVDCLVRTKVTNWYAGQSCTLCGKALDTAEWAEHQPAVMAPSGDTLEWRDIRPETVPDVLTTHSPVCWDCHVAETFRRTRPDLVLDNPHAGRTVH